MGGVRPARKTGLRPGSACGVRAFFSPLRETRCVAGPATPHKDHLPNSMESGAVPLLVGFVKGLAGGVGWAAHPLLRLDSGASVQINPVCSGIHGRPRSFEGGEFSGQHVAGVEGAYRVGRGLHSPEVVFVPYSVFPQPLDDLEPHPLTAPVAPVAAFAEVPRPPILDFGMARTGRLWRPPPRW